jgi:hypothetical protein
MKLGRPNPLYLLAALLVIATIVYSFVAVGSGDPNSAGRRTGSVYDAGLGGAGALRRFVEGMGASTTVLQGDSFTPDAARAGALFVIASAEALSSRDVEVITEYVRAGGTAVVATDFGFAERPLLDAYEMRASGIAAPGTHPLAGAFFSDPVARSFALDRGVTFTIGASSVALASDGRSPVVVAQRAGRGQLVVVGSTGPFLASGLREADNGRFVLALVHDVVARRGTVAFDEYHHGFHPTTDVLVLLQKTWPGRAVVFVALAAFLYLVLSGRRLGPAIPLEQRPPRSSLEYIRGFAGLVRRSGHGEIARRRLQRDLRSGLARRLGLDAGTPFARVLATLAVNEPATAAEARALDDALEHRLREDQLVRSVRQIERLLGAKR